MTNIMTNIMESLPPSCALHALPPEILLGHVVPFLPLPSRLRLGSTCRALHGELFSNIALWDSLDFAGSQDDVPEVHTTSNGNVLRLCDVQLVTDTYLGSLANRSLESTARSSLGLTELVLRGLPVTFPTVWRIAHDLVPAGQLTLVDLILCFNIVAMARSTIHVDPG
ncbi:hypothetical protein M427DRAFT_411642 [Gonapodya prolifera JEL478]|uniref:F-box domain-containing protein n=1 Tax=Gonapodya prolifera (strain JEL478) TaxID=1344416 RepID=A0A139A5E5_GONPJ|nr:hypothetical protein M427DRAFT_411642 [Gonapodya prolifera JEL478]|eukprot:KXS11974.1 hypothetical protein M427DRAFT_411642 [Gonapodya prolifera JEL478]